MAGKGGTGQSSWASMEREISCCRRVTFSGVKSTVGALASSINAVRCP